MKYICAAFLFIILAGCDGKSAVSPSAPSPGKPSPGPEPVTGISVQRPGPGLSVRPIPTAKPFDGSILRGHEFLLEPGAGPVPQVRDPDLGPLGTDKTIRDVAVVFFDRTAEGTVDDSLLVPRWAEYLEKWALDSKAAGWSKGTVRTGIAIADTRGGLMVPVKVFQNKIIYVGWLYLVKSDDQFLVSDVKVWEPVKTTGPYDPDSKGQEISSPNRR